MAELDWEPAPPLDMPVPRSRDWVGPAFDAWTRLFYGRRGFVVLNLFILPFWLVWQFAKLLIYAGGILFLLAAALVTMAVDLCTYPRRRRKAVQRAWTQYVAELHGKDVPPDYQ